MHPSMTNIGAYISARLGTPPFLATAGGTGDNTATFGVGIDRTGFQSCVLVGIVDATLAAAETVTLTSIVEDAVAVGGPWAAYVPPEGAATATVVVADGATETGIAEVDIDLHAARQFIRQSLTVVHSAGATDTSRQGGTIVLGGAVELPA